MVTHQNLQTGSHIAHILVLVRFEFIVDNFFGSVSDSGSLSASISASGLVIHKGSGSIKVQTKQAGSVQFRFIALV